MSVEALADDGCRLWTEQAGNGPPLMLCHGGPGLWDYFDGVARAVARFLAENAERHA